MLFPNVIVQISLILCYLWCSILKECDVHLYRQMGGVRDDLTIHEKTLDILINLLKKEQVGGSEGIPLVASPDSASSYIEVTFS